jgi:PleD family two-component response regulator
MLGRRIFSSLELVAGSSHDYFQPLTLPTETSDKMLWSRGTRRPVTTNKTRNQTTKDPKILVVDDSEQVRTSLEKVLEVVQITTAADAGEVLHLIDTKPFDVLLSDLHMTEAGDGSSMVSAMHPNSDAVTLNAHRLPRVGTCRLYGHGGMPCQSPTEIGR